LQHAEIVLGGRRGTASRQVVEEGRATKVGMLEQAFRGGRTILTALSRASLRKPQNWRLRREVARLPETKRPQKREETMGLQMSDRQKPKSWARDIPVQTVADCHADVEGLLHV
jgi:hypothetical protein